MVERIREVSPRLTARITGGLYLIVIVTAGFAQVFVRGRLVVRTDAAATAANILAHEALYRSGFAADLVNFACYIAVTALFYRLFWPVNRSVSLVAAFFSLAGCVVGAVDCLFQLAPLYVLGREQYSNVFNAGQVQALTLLVLRLQAISENITIVFFGVYCFLIGCLVFRSTFLPRVLGVLMAVGGLCYEFGIFSIFLSPPFAAYLLPYILLPGFVAELLLTLWLLSMGVNAQRWKEQAGATAQRLPPANS